MAQDTGALLINAGNSFASSINNAGALRLDQEREARIAKFQEENAAFEKEKFRLQQEAARQKSNVNILTTAASLAKTDPTTAKFILESAFVSGGGDPKDPSFKRFGDFLDKKVKDDAATTAEILNYAASKGLDVPTIASSFSDPDKLVGFLKDFQAFKKDAEEAQQPTVTLPSGDLATPEAAAAAAKAGGGVITAPDKPFKGVNIMLNGQVQGYDTSTDEGRKGAAAALKAGGSIISTGVQATSVEGVLGKDKVSAREVMTTFNAAKVVIAGANRVIAQLGDEDVTTALTSSVIRGLDSMANQLTQLAGTFQGDDREFLTNLRANAEKKLDLTKHFGEHAAKSAVFRSNLVNVLYAKGRLEAGTGHALSDKDIEFQRDALAISSGSKSQMKAVMADVIEQAKIRAKLELETAHQFNVVPEVQLPQELQPTSSATPGTAKSGPIKTLNGKRYVTDGTKWYQLP